MIATRAAMAGACGLGIIGTGCVGLPRCTVVEPQYVLVERRESQVDGRAARSEITETPAYKSLRSGFRTVALRLPDNCYQAELHRGQNQETAQLESSCGIPLQVLERSLTMGGFQVLSWSTLMGIEHQQNVPVHIAAQQLGADFVIIVNDMFVGQAEAGSTAEARYRYFSSDPEGHRTQPAELFTADRGWLKDFVRTHAGADPHAAGKQTLQARLNATVVLSKGVDAAPPAPAGPRGAPAAASAAAAAASAARQRQRRRRRSPARGRAARRSGFTTGVWAKKTPRPRASRCSSPASRSLATGTRSPSRRASTRAIPIATTGGPSLPTSWRRSSRRHAIARRRKRISRPRSTSNPIRRRAFTGRSPTTSFTASREADRCAASLSPSWARSL